MKRALAVTLLLAGPASAQSNVPPPALADTQLPDATQERSAKALMETLRCLVCQGQSIADSDADMAADMRALVRQRIASGEQPDRVRDWLIERYGDYVSYDPPLSPATGLLWATPLLLLGIGVGLARRSLKRGPR
ncbi:cytochrome C biogenesis protein [Sphingomonas sp. Leaf24]|uniref:cytochrome c-type biogenesis protein n=1 Tax=unclassified Sphingomonas TaxID=196159 RepID=UPI0006F28643|nr:MULTISPECIES: cytochrome c-type biogenesis protein [unclassified Sphingomonas]KQM21710.1 cytochrome C biogenesis protein [Sphingomonas sp. Leaf5]KQM93811.1 cytochrome C biogenesis protein [Sphingomonas sp. Leaf24]